MISFVHSATEDSRDKIMKTKLEINYKHETYHHYLRFDWLFRFDV